MPRSARQEATSGIYHVTTRGAGRRIVFEDDGDKRRFLAGLRCLTENNAITLLAWCLMDNHVHLPVEADIEDLSRGLHRLSTSYACYYNGKHGHVGPVFQNRFASNPVETDEHLLATVRYIHLNPLDRGASSPESYYWSSYREYLRKPQLCNTSIVLDLVGGKDRFIQLCNPANERDYPVEPPGKRSRLSEVEAEQVAISYLGPNFADQLALLNRKERNACIYQLKEAGLSIRQIERLTGIGRNIIARA